MTYIHGTKDVYSTYSFTIQKKVEPFMDRYNFCPFLPWICHGIPVLHPIPVARLGILPNPSPINGSPINAPHRTFQGFVVSRCVVLWLHTTRVRNHCLAKMIVFCMMWWCFSNHPFLWPETCFFSMVTNKRCFFNQSGMFVRSLRLKNPKWKSLWSQCFMDWRKNT